MEEKKMKVDEDTIKVFLHRLEKLIDFKPNSFMNDSVKIINQIKNRQFTMVIDNANEHFRIELPIVKHTYLRKPSQENINNFATKEMYSRIFALSGKKEQAFYKLYEQPHYCRSNSYELDDLKERMDIIIEEIIQTLKEEVGRLAIAM